MECVFSDFSARALTSQLYHPCSTLTYVTAAVLFRRRFGSRQTSSCFPGDREMDKVVTSTAILDQSVSCRSEPLRNQGNE